MPHSFTHKTLADHNGQEGNPSYVAVDGQVYDVSKSPMWKNGAHMARHQAGHDLTAELSAAPHGQEVLARDHIEQVGTLVASDPDEHLPGWIRLILRLAPLARRHPHPISIHFPTAFCIAAMLFTVIDLIHPNWLNVDFKIMTTAMFVLAVIFTPPAIATGLFTWWVNYAFKMTHFIACKLIFAATFVVAELACIAIKLSGFAEHPIAGWMYTGLIFWLAINVMILGYYGGQIVFPTKKPQALSKES